jgi:O-antigen/teichoic acid export membrane protein
MAQISSVKKNIIANFVGKLWIGIVTFAFVPLYIKLIGIEEYGFIGLYISLLAGLSILDIGLSSTLTRELSRLSIMKGMEQEERDLVRTFEIIYLAIGILIGIFIIVSAPCLANHWIKDCHISTRTSTIVLMMIGLLIAFQWPTILYSGGLMGKQRYVSINLIKGIAATLQAGGAVLILRFISPTVLAYFIWQILVGIMQTVVFARHLWDSLPYTNERSVFKKTLLRKNLKFSLGVTGITIMTIILTQADKIIISKFLPLAIFSYYMIATNISSILSQLAGQISSVLFPRISQFAAENRIADIAILYHKGCQIVSAIIIPLALVLVFFSKEVLLIWLQDQDLAQKIYLILNLLVIGTALNSLMAIPFIMQLAYGWTSLLFYTNVVSVLVLIPLLIFMTLSFGIIGATVAWVILNTGYLLILIPLMHSRLLKEEMRRWYYYDIGLPILAGFFVCFLFRFIMPGNLSKYTLLTWIFIAGAVTWVIVSLSMSFTRGWLKGMLYTRLN